MSTVVPQAKDSRHHGPLEKPVDGVDGKVFDCPVHGQRPHCQHEHERVERGHDGEILEDIVEGEGNGWLEATRWEGLLQLSDGRHI